MSSQYDDMAGEEQDVAEHPDNSHKYAGDVVPLPIKPMAAPGDWEGLVDAQNKRNTNAVLRRALGGGAPVSIK